MTQIDFLVELGRELDGAAGRLVRNRRRTRARSLLVPAASLALLAAIAVAVWPTVPADPEREAAAPGQMGEMRQMLGVLRRDETEADAGPAAREGREALAKIVSGDAVFRLAGTRADGGGVVVAAGERVSVHTLGPLECGPTPGSCAPPSAAPGAAACLYDPGAGLVGCWTAEEIRNGWAHIEADGDLHGLAPDGAARATASVERGDLSAPVRDNHFLVSEFRTGDELIAFALQDEEGDFVARDVGDRDVRVTAVPEEELHRAQALAEAPDVAPGGRPVQDVPAAIAEAGRPVPFPSGFSHQAWVLPDGLRMVETSGDAQRVAEHSARCMWLRFWLAAVQAGDEAVAGQAARVIDTLPRWPTLRAATDEHRAAVAEVRDGPATAVARRVALSCGGTPVPSPSPTPEP